jgi:hypothetical protein
VWSQRGIAGEAVVESHVAVTRDAGFGEIVPDALVIPVLLVIAGQKRW